jgi:hypothetical protein
VQREQELSESPEERTEMKGKKKRQQRKVVSLKRSNQQQKKKRKKKKKRENRRRRGRRKRKKKIQAVCARHPPQVERLASEHPQTQPEDAETKHEQKQCKKHIACKPHPRGEL